MAKRKRAPARRGRATQTAQQSRKTAKKTASKTKRKSTSKTAQKSAVAQTMQASLARRRVYTPELLTYVRQRFEQTADSMADIGLDLGISREGVRLLGKRECWKRYERPPHGLPPGLPPAVRLSTQAGASGHPLQDQPGAAADGAAVLPQAEREGGIPPLADTLARLHRAVLDELAAIETLRTHSRRAGTSAHVTRMLATLTETLQKLQRLQSTRANTGPDNADMPADIDEFRKDLAHRIDEFVASRAHPVAAGGSPIAAADAAV